MTTEIYNNVVIIKIIIIKGIVYNFTIINWYNNLNIIIKIAFSIVLLCII